MENKRILGVCMVLLFVCSSCTTVKTICIQEPIKQYAGNAYKEMKGFTENQILRKMSSPNRTESDGAGGKILVYEDIQIVTNSTDSHTSHTSSSSYGTAQAGYNAWTGNPQVNSKSQGSSTTTNTTNAKSVTREEKAYVNFFVGSNGICYDVATNSGDYFSTTPGEYRCAKIYKDANPNLLWTLIPPLTIFVGIPCAVVYGVTKAKEGKVKEWLPDEKCGL